MATLLECYYTSKNTFSCNPHMVMPCPEEVSRQQEILYRIEVLESCQLFVKTAPLTAEPKALYWHYLMVDAYFRNLRTERCLAVHANEDVQKRRDTALGNLDRVIQDYQNRFKSFAPSGDADHYRKKITGVIQTVLSVWVQYRQTFIEISKEAA